jgi:NTE family protein
MWAYGPTDFDDFDQTVDEMLGRGLQLELVRRALSPIALGRSIGNTTAALLFHHPQLRNRTDSLITAFAGRPFGAKTMSQVSHPDLATVISATDVITGNAVRFGSATSSCSPYGRIAASVSVAEAVAASAAYPVVFPPITRKYRFQRLDGSITEPIAVVMTDGGVYDNLGLSPIVPGRSASHTSHSYDLDYLIAVDAGIGRFPSSPARFFLPRLTRSFKIVYGKTQDAGRARIHLADQTSQIKGFVHAYLGMKDEKLPVPLADLVPRERVCGYPTNFAAMTRQDLLALSIRGEQLTRALLQHYCPELG